MCRLAVKIPSIEDKKLTFNRGGSRNFGKEGPVRGQSPELSAEGASAGGGSGGLLPKNVKN